MQMWRGCLPIIGCFAELQERHAVTQTSEPGIKSEHSEGERTRGNGRRLPIPRAMRSATTASMVKERYNEHRIVAGNALRLQTAFCCCLHEFVASVAQMSKNTVSLSPCRCVS